MTIYTPPTDPVALEQNVAEPAPFWDEDSIQAVIRAASRRGICPTSLIAETDSHRMYSSGAPSLRLG
jgi:hypothetical protein